MVSRERRRVNGTDTSQGETPAADDMGGAEADDEGSLGKEDEPHNGDGDKASRHLSNWGNADNFRTPTGRGSSPDDNEVTAQVPHPIEGSKGGTTRSGRKIKVTERARESYAQQSKKWHG